MTKYEQWAYYIDIWRVWPRVLLVCISYFAYQVGMWFMGLDKPSAEQSAFASLLSVAYAKVLDWYMANGVNWTERLRENLSAGKKAKATP